MTDEVWVKACPEHLDSATRRLILGLARAGHGERAIRVELSVRGKTACLSMCVERLLREAEFVPIRDLTCFVPETSRPGDLDRWFVRRAMERQQGSLRIRDVSATCRCYELSLPLASPKMACRP